VHLRHPHYRAGGSGDARERCGKKKEADADQRLVAGHDQVVAVSLRERQKAEDPAELCVAEEHETGDRRSMRPKTTMVDT